MPINLFTFDIRIGTNKYTCTQVPLAVLRRQKSSDWQRNKRSPLGGSAKRFGHLWICLHFLGSLRTDGRRRRRGPLHGRDHGQCGVHAPAAGIVGATGGRGSGHCEHGLVATDDDLRTQDNNVAHEYGGPAAWWPGAHTSNGGCGQPLHGSGRESGVNAFSLNTSSTTPALAAAVRWRRGERVKMADGREPRTEQQTRECAAFA